MPHAVICTAPKVASRVHLGCMAASRCSTCAAAGPALPAPAPRPVPCRRRQSPARLCCSVSARAAGRPHLGRRPLPPPAMHLPHDRRSPANTMWVWEHNQHQLCTVDSMAFHEYLKLGPEAHLASGDVCMEVCLCRLNDSLCHILR